MKLEDIKKLIHDKALNCDRDPNSIDLLIVTKKQPMNKIEPLIARGQRLFGENQVQEALKKWSDLKSHHPDLQLHMIGHLQSNKAKEAVALFDVIQTLDSISLADKLASEEYKQKKYLSYYIQINIGEEKQKAGIHPEDSHDFIGLIKKDYPLNLVGLMCIPPKNLDPRCYFQQLAQLAHKHNLNKISMGMSSDFEIAIECGATILRIGTAIFAG